MTVLWVRNPAVLWRETTEGVVLLPASAEEPFALTASGAALWDLLEAPIALDDAVRRLAAAYAATPDVVQADVRPVLAELERRDAVRQVP